MSFEDGKIYVDCTLGGGGHSELILKRISPNGKLISFDIDDEAIAHSKERLKTVIFPDFVRATAQWSLVSSFQTF